MLKGFLRNPYVHVSSLQTRPLRTPPVRERVQRDMFDVAGSWACIRRRDEEDRNMPTWLLVLIVVLVVLALFGGFGYSRR